MTYETFEIVINDTTVAYCAVDKKRNQFGYAPVEDESLSTVLKYVVDEPSLNLTVLLDDGMQFRAIEPKDDLFIKALNHHLPRKYHVANVQKCNTDKSIKSYLNYLLKGEYLEEAM